MAKDKDKKKKDKIPRPSPKILGTGLAEKAASAAKRRRDLEKKLLKKIK